MPSLERHCGNSLEPELLLDDPVIRDNRLLIGYAIPDLVEMRSLENGAITQKLNLDPPSGSLASAPLLLARGFIVAFERGRISRYLDDGTQTLEYRPAPHRLGRATVSR